MLNFQRKMINFFQIFSHFLFFFASLYSFFFLKFKPSVVFPSYFHPSHFFIIFSSSLNVIFFILKDIFIIFLFFSFNSELHIVCINFLFFTKITHHNDERARFLQSQCTKNFFCEIFIVLVLKFTFDSICLFSNIFFYSLKNIKDITILFYIKNDVYAEIEARVRVNSSRFFFLSLCGMRGEKATCGRIYCDKLLCDFLFNVKAFQMKLFVFEFDELSKGAKGHFLNVILIFMCVM